MNDSIETEEEKIKSIKKRVYVKEISNLRSVKPRKDSEMVESVVKIIKEEADKCF